MKRVKPKKCRNRWCKQEFVPDRPLQTVCSPKCAQDLIEQRKVKEDAKRAKETRAQIMERKLAVKPLQYWLKRAQKAVNSYCSARDLKAGYGCITCGTRDAVAWTAGHWISVGASSATRFDPANIHLQCHQDNFFKGGLAQEYEARLPARIGQAEVDRLKNAKRERKWTREECQAIESEFKAKLKEIQHGNN